MMDWDKAYRDHHSEVLRYLVRRAYGNRPLAEDLAQDVFVRAMRCERQFTDNGNGVVPWLLTIARTILLDHFKSSRVQREELWDAPPSPVLAPSVEHEVLARQRTTLVLGAVASLPPDYREPVVLSYWGGMQDQQIAAQLGRTVGAVKMLKLRGRQSLQRRLAGVA